MELHPQPSEPSLSILYPAWQTQSEEMAGAVPCASAGGMSQDKASPPRDTRGNRPTLSPLTVLLFQIHFLLQNTLGIPK